MWTRAELKEQAKEVLSCCYWRSFLVSILIAIGTVGNGGSGGSANSNHSGAPLAKEIIYIIIIIVIVLILFRLFVGYMLEVSGRKFFTQAALNDINLGYIGFSFKRGRYIDIFKSMFLMGIYLLLWTLLLIIPGIIKCYAYRFVPFILGDNPNIGASRAIELSNAMTDGHKFDIFILDLSFLGWIILAMIPLGLGLPFLAPYIDATNAQLYLTMRSHAIKYGLTTEEELNIVSENNTWEHNDL